MSLFLKVAMGEICKQVSVGFVCHHIPLTLQVAKMMCNWETRRGEESKSCTACNHGVEDNEPGRYSYGDKWLISSTRQFQIKHSGKVVPKIYIPRTHLLP